MLLRLKLQGLDDIFPRILVVCILCSAFDLPQNGIDFPISYFLELIIFVVSYQVTRLLPDAVGTTCGERMEKVYGAEHSHIIRVPFRTEKGMLRKWISRFEVWPYMETFTEVEHNTNKIYFETSHLRLENVC